MKGPQSVFLDEVRHDRTARIVENALCGAGNLSRFFGFVETATFSQFGETPKFSPRPRRVPEQPTAILKEWDRLSLGQLLQPLGTYMNVWKQVEREVPVFQEAPAAGHLFALARLTRQRPLWETEKLSAPSYSTPQRINAKSDTVLHPHRPYFEGLTGWIHRQGTRPLQPSQTSTASKRRSAPFPVWQRNKLEFIFGESSARSVSLYLDDAEHAFFYNLFGNSFFERTEFVLDYLLNDQRNWLDVEPESQFLEHGTELLELEGAAWDPDAFEEEAHLIRENSSRFHNVGDPDERLSNEEILEALDLTAWSEEMAESTFLTSASPTQKRSLRLAARLGLLFTHNDNLESVRKSITGHFLEAYSLSAALPECEAAYRILEGRHSSHLNPEPKYRNAVDYHIFELFKLYALQVVPGGATQPQRASLPVLATLGQPWCFRTKSTLEAFSGYQVNKTATGSWQFVKARKVALELSNTEAFRVARCLRGVADFYDVGAFRTVFDFITEGKLAGKNRVAVKTGLVVIERALAKVRLHGNDYDPAQLWQLGWEVLADLLEDTASLRVDRTKMEAYLRPTKRNPGPELVNSAKAPAGDDLDV